MTLLSIGDFHFKGTRDHFLNGEYLVTLDGWEDAVPMRSSSQPIPQGHGDFDVPTFMEGRTVNFTANVYARNPMELAHRGRGFIALFAQGNSRVVTIELDGQTLWGMARAGIAAPTWQRARGGVALARVSMELKFPNPRKFGDTRTFAAGSPAYHFGNFPSTPVHTVTGVNGSGYTINGPDGKTFTVTQPVTSGNPHTVDMATGFLEVGGVVVVGQVTSADTWAVPGGGTVTHTLTGSGLTLSTAVTDTYI